MTRLMTEREKADILVKAAQLRQAGKTVEAMELQKTFPMPPFLAKFAKEHGHIDYFVKTGWNMAEAEATFGPEWLTR